MTGGGALYVYCVVPASGTAPASAPPVSAPALDGGWVHAVRWQDLAALAHRCQPEPYQGSEDQVRAWVAAHNAVVEEAWQRAGSVLPMAFDVIVRGGEDHAAEENLAGWLAERGPVLRERLEFLAGRVEVGVQVLWEVARLGGSETAGLAAPQAPARGAAFFAQQRSRRQAAEQLQDKARSDSGRYAEALAALADEVHANKLRAVKDRQMVLNLSLLVREREIAQIGKYLETISGEPGLEVRFTGPWPPYSFAGSLATIEESSDQISQDSETGSSG